MNARREEYVIGMADEFGEISVRVSVPATEGQKVLSEHDREMLAGEMAQNLALHLAECLMSWHSEVTAITLRRSDYRVRKREGRH